MGSYLIETVSEVNPQSNVVFSAHAHILIEALTVNIPLGKGEINK